MCTKPSLARFEVALFESPLVKGVEWLWNFGRFHPRSGFAIRACPLAFGLARMAKPERG